MANEATPKSLELDRAPVAGVAELSSQVGFRIRFAQAALWKDLLETFRPFGLRPQHFAAMTMIAAQPGITQQDVSVALGLHGSNLVTLLDGLAKPGLVERRQSPSDRRFNGLYLSAAGQSLLDRMNEAQHRHEARLAAVLSPEEQTQLVALLRRLERISQA